MLRSPRVEKWREALRAYGRVALDTNVVIYALQNVLPYGELARYLLYSIERGFMIGIVPTVVQAEVLVKPFRERDRLALRKTDLFFRSSQYLLLRSCDRTIARRAAQVRASTRLTLPDSIIVATAIEERCDALIGNDASMMQHTFGTPYLYLDDYVA